MKLSRVDNRKKNKKKKQRQYTVYNSCFVMYGKLSALRTRAFLKLPTPWDQDIVDRIDHNSSSSTMNLSCGLSTTTVMAAPIFFFITMSDLITREIVARLIRERNKTKGSKGPPNWGSQSNRSHFLRFHDKLSCNSQMTVEPFTMPPPP